MTYSEVPAPRTGTDPFTWGDIIPADRHDEFEMVERFMIRPGDVVWSSHYGLRTVTDQLMRGMVVELRFDITPDRIWNEIYDRENLIPRKKS